MTSPNDMRGSNSLRQHANLHFEDSDGPGQGPRNLMPDRINGRQVMRSTGTRETTDDEYLDQLERERIAQANGQTSLKRTHKTEPQDQRPPKAVAPEVAPSSGTKPEAPYIPDPTNWKSIDSPINDPKETVEWEDSMFREPTSEQQRLDGLVSSGFPYGGRNYMHIRPLNWDELEILARAAEQDSVDLVMRAVDRCIDIPVRMLAIPDFYQILYWLRINSYPEMPYMMEWICDEPEANQPGATCNHENHSPLGRTSLQATDLEELGWGPNSVMPEHLDWPRCYLLPEMLMLQRQASYKQLLEVAEAALRQSDLTSDQRRQANAEYLAIQNKQRRARGYLENVCQTPDILNPATIEALKWIKPGRTLAEKRNFMRKHKGLALYQQAMKLESQYRYGIYEQVKVDCERCGASRGFRLVVDVPVFLS